MNRIRITTATVIASKANHLASAAGILALTISAESFALGHDEAPSHITLSAETRFLSERGRGQVWAFEGAPLLDSAEINRNPEELAQLSLTLRIAGWDLRAAFGGMDAIGNATAESPDSTQNLLFPTIDEVPDRGSAYYYYENFFKTGQADLSTDYEYMDIEIGHEIGLGWGDGRLFVGVRDVEFDETLNLSLQSDGLNRDHSLDTLRQQRFEGIGPRIGFAARFPLGPDGVNSLFAFETAVDLTMLSGDRGGEIRSRFQQEASTVAGDEGAVDETFISPLADSGDRAIQSGLSLGISFRHSLIGVSLGYRIERWENFVNTETRNERLDIPRFGQRDGAINLHGGWLRLELNVW